jgi:hypothetical protein
MRSVSGDRVGCSFDREAYVWRVVFVERPGVGSVPNFGHSRRLAKGPLQVELSRPR